jgi:tetratricopeptide (TPR) repeat protein
MEEEEAGPEAEPHMAALETEPAVAPEAAVEQEPEAAAAPAVPEALIEAVVEVESEAPAPDETLEVETLEAPEPAAEAMEETAGEIETEAARAFEAEPGAPAYEPSARAEWEEPDYALPEGQAEAASVGLVEQPTPVEPAAPEPDFLTRYFEELAATPEETEAPAEEAAPEAPPADIDLLESVEEALTDLSPVPIIPPPRRNAESYLDEGNVYFNVGQYGLAIERYTQAVELDQNLIAAFYNRANARTRAGEFDAALQDYDRALRLQPNDADALNNRGMLHLYRANYAEALRDFNGALAADPSDTTVMVNRGLAQLHGGDPASALVDFREAATMDPADAAAHYGAAQASASLGNRDEALRHIGLALRYDPGYAREAAGDPRLAILQGDETFLRLLRESGSRST